jgi:2,4-dienoyl-CoA reductase-like NADH-dependent reductase (Old Yellow Enzyme family)
MSSDKTTGSRRHEGSKFDTTILAQPIKFPFSGRTAPNRLLKAPMTERLCQWSGEGQDIVFQPRLYPSQQIIHQLTRNQTARGVPTPELTNLYKTWGEGRIGIKISGNIMVRYDAVEAYGNPILYDNHDGRISEYKKLATVAKAHGSIFIA